MARQSPILTSLNRGEVSPQLLGRTDLEHLRMAAQIQENFQPRVLGPMQMRPGSANVGQVQGGNYLTKLIPFVASFGETAIIELNQNQMRVWKCDAADKIPPYLVTRAAVGTSIADFGALGGWTTTSTGAARINSNTAGLAIWNVNSGASATAWTAVSVDPADQATEHALRFNVLDGPIQFQVGLSATDDSIFGAQVLDTGVYSMAFTPNAGTIYVTFTSYINPETTNTLTQTQPNGLMTVRVGKIAVESAGVMTIPTPWGDPSLLSPLRSGAMRRRT